MGQGSAGKFRGATHERAWSWLLSKEPDVALVQEAAGPALRSGYRCLCLPYMKWASMVVTRDPASVCLEPAEGSALARMTSYVAVARLTLGDVETTAVSVHTPARPVPTAWLTDQLDPVALARPGEQVFHNDWTFAALAADVSGSFLIGGDWNTCRAYDPPSHRSFTGGNAFFDRAATAGWLHAGPMDEESTYQRFQLDHAFVKGFDVERSWVDRSALDAGLSDHAPLFVELAPR